MGKTNKKLYEMTEDDFRDYIPGAVPFLKDKYYVFNEDDCTFQSIIDDYSTLDLCKEFVTVDRYFGAALQKKDGFNFTYGKNLDKKILEYSQKLEAIGFDVASSRYAVEIQNLIHQEYTGHLTRLNDNLSNVCMRINTGANQDILENTNYSKANKKFDYNIPEKFRKNAKCIDTFNCLQPFYPPEINSFWKYIQTITLPEMWQHTRRIYTLNPSLAVDFLNQEELIIPYSNLEYLPYKVFYMDFSNMKNLLPFPTMLSMEGVLVRIIREEDVYRIYLLYHFKKSRSENYFAEQWFEINKGEDFSLTRKVPFGTNPASTMEQTTNAFQKIDNYMSSFDEYVENFKVSTECLKDITCLSFASYMESKYNMLCFRDYHKHIRNLHVFDFSESKDSTAFNPEVFDISNYYFTEIFRILNTKTDGKKKISTKEIGIETLKEVHNFYWQMEGFTRITLWTLFYLGCKGHREENPNKEYIYKESAGEKKEQHISLGDSLDYLHLNYADYGSDIITKYVGTGKGRKLTKVRFTRGHRQHYWYGSEKDGNRHREYIYVDPYISNLDGTKINHITKVVD